ncbi:hypothetical protein [Phenylobacterium sp. J367]|uniref:hypothetical protein n=1 Tax=Phenylobacterium sp. J367 TaxID=2898435 RepID=UPI0021517D0C|nr:hypothetical protein [Phenylobacterium sp. J367]MCR5879657.1 hypothetical protein [Phenylobacterium sp. J367]
MTPGAPLAALALALSIAAAPVFAQIAGVDSICEVTPGGVNTVRVRLMSLTNLDYTFRRGGTQYVFPSLGLSSAPRTFALPAGTYTLTYKHPNSTPVGTFPSPVVVKPFAVTGESASSTSPTVARSRHRR